MTLRITLLLAALALGGCSGTGAEKLDGKLSVVKDNYCDIAKKVEWSTNDTPQTIHGVRRENAKFDRLCGPGGNAK